MSTPVSLTLPDCVTARTISTPRGGFAALDALPPSRRGGQDGATALLVPGFTGSKEDFLAVLEPLASDGFRRAYYFRARDAVGAWGAWNTPRYVRVDRYAPAVSATNASDQWFPSRTATISASEPNTVTPAASRAARLVALEVRRSSSRETGVVTRLIRPCS